MSLLVKRLIDVVVAIAITLGLVLVMLVISNILIAKTNSLVGFKLWLAFATRPDILGSVILTALVSMGYVFWQQTKGRSR